jgi:hypothetical protein
VKKSKRLKGGSFTPKGWLQPGPRTPWEGRFSTPSEDKTLRSQGLGDLFDPEATGVEPAILEKITMMAGPGSTGRLSVASRLVAENERVQAIQAAHKFIRDNEGTYDAVGDYADNPREGAYFGNKSIGELSKLVPLNLKVLRIGLVNEEDEERDTTVHDAFLPSIATLTTLEVVAIIGCNIANVEPLAMLTSVTELYLPFNSIELTKESFPLEALSLEILDLSNNQITDVSLLQTMTSLKSLDLNNNQIVNVEPLATLTSLTELRLLNNQIVNVEPLATLTSLTIVDLGRNNIKEWYPIESNLGLKLRWPETPIMKGLYQVPRVTRQ